MPIWVEGSGDLQSRDILLASQGGRGYISLRRCGRADNVLAYLGLDHLDYDSIEVLCKIGFLSDSFLSGCLGLSTFGVSKGRYLLRGYELLSSKCHKGSDMTGKVFQPIEYKLN